MVKSPDPAAGAISFQLLAEIAFGATARIDLCRAIKASRPGIEGQFLAVKRLHPHVAEDPGFANQFLDEVWMTAALKSPNVVEVRGWGTDDQGAYLAVELVQGVALARLMKTVFETGEVFSERMVVFMGSRLCRGLAAAHALRAPNGEVLNLVHRDLTPANVLIGFNGDVKIADFGLAKAKQRLTKTLTGMRKGEPTYMAPEQARADDIDARADLFSLGVILFELFAGRRPWLAKSDFEMVQVTMRDAPADLRELRPKIDKELVSVVNKCLVKDPGGRFQYAAEIGERLENWLTVHGYQEGNEDALARFVRRNAMKQMRWFERAVTGELAPKPKVGRNLPPRVPTYVDTGERMPAVKVNNPTLPMSPAASGSQQPSPAAGGRLRTPPPPMPPPMPAAGAPPHRAPLPGVRTPPPPPPSPGRAGAAPMPPGDDETDITDAAWKIGRQVQAKPPVILAMPSEGDLDAETETGEEIPTLIQSGSPQLEALRAMNAKRREAAGLQAFTGLSVTPALVTDEDSDLRTTSIKKGAGRHGAHLINDMDSEEFPTEPVRGADLAQAGIRRPSQRSDPTRSLGLPPAAKATVLDAPRAPPGKIAPALPGVPSPPAQGSANGAATGPLPAFGQGTPLPSFGTPSSPSFGVPPPALPFEMQEPPSGRGSNDDDVEVIDRGKLGTSMTVDMVVSEADRLAIEAVRRKEDARAAAVRAERKATVAQLASEAAMIAAEAVRLARTMGLAAAVKRLEDARKLEAAMERPDSAAAARGQAHDAAIGGGEGTGTTPQFGGASGPSSATGPLPMMEAAQQGTPKPLPRPAGFFQESKVPAPVLTTMPFPRMPAQQPTFLQEAAAAAATGSAPMPPAGGVTLQSTEDIRAKFRPQVFGMPPLAIAGLGIVAFCIVFLILWLFFG